MKFLRIFEKLIELHKFEFFGQYDTDEIKGDLMQNKYPFENLKPFLINFCNRRKLEMIVSNLEK